MVFLGGRWTVGGNKEFERTHMQQNKKGNICGEKQTDRNDNSLLIVSIYSIKWEAKPWAKIKNEGTGNTNLK